ncbi:MULTISPECIES: hypothetical protein [unclassified Massilia]|uniref:hypothetical protein n=1 Tax=unclassified Massilia TaxID=2609279 RepID=UPI00177EABED|nr:MULTISPECIES: hypothetical protein [unclassified Massilia]MBD8529201.1 hypothetical protein [Massilia sp. CFBP 13647]MBD8672595.1 hypothetical protein [Massilia sp. CFBP 13721]
MSQALRDFYLLWRMARSTRHKRRIKWLLGAIALIVVVTFLLFLESRDVLLAVGVGVRIALAGLTLVAVMSFLPGAVKLNTPINAQLVPRMRRRLMQLTAGVWVTATAVATLVALGTRLPAPLVFLATGSFIATQGLALSGHRAGFYLQFVGYAILGFGGSNLVGEALERAAGGWYFVVCAGLMVVFSAYALKAMFMGGGDRHYALRERQRHQLDPLGPQGHSGERNRHRLSTALYVGALRRDCARRNAGKLLAHLLGPKDHWTSQTLALAAIVVPMAGAMLLIRHHGGDTLRRLLAGLGWAFAAGFLLGPLVRGATESVLVTQFSLCCLMLPLLGLNLRDQARLGSMLGSSVFLFLLASAAVSLVAGLILYAATGLPVMPGAALTSIVITCVDMAQHWRRSADAPFAFPVGRLA